MNMGTTVNDVIIVGAGVAGVTTAAALRQGGFAGNVQIFDHGQFAYDRPPLSKEFLLGTAAREDIALYSPDWFVEHDITYHANIRVTAIDRDQCAIETETGARHEYDRLVFATGGLAIVPEWVPNDSARVHTLRTVEDAESLREVLASGVRLLVVGAGLLGAEIAIAAEQRGARVTTADPNPAPMAEVVGPRLATWLLERLTARGIEHHIDSVASVRDTDSEVLVKFASGAAQDFDQIVVAVGLKPEIALAQSAGIDGDTAIYVDTQQRTSDPQILAVGDCAVTPNLSDTAVVVGHWDAAKVAGERAAAAILGEEPSERAASWFWSDRGDLHLDVVGRLAICDQLVERGEFGSESFAIGGFVADKLVAVVCINDPLSTRHFRKIMDRGRELTAAQFADPDTALRKVAAGK